MSKTQEILLALEFDEAQPLPEWNPCDSLITAGDEPVIYEMSLTYDEMEGIAVPGTCVKCQDDGGMVDRDGLCERCR